VKKYSLAFVLLFVSFIVVLFSCKKINEATTLGGDLIPAVDNVTTFDTSLQIITMNGRLDDSVRVAYSDPVALGDVNDPEFGNVHANFYFSLSSPSYGIYPFNFKKDSIHVIDSVVLSLAYAGAYGDTLSNGIQTITVSEIDPGAGFRSDTSYRYKDLSPNSFPVTQLGTKTYNIKNLKDTFYSKEPGDTGTSVTKYTNILRIKLNNSLGTKLASFDTTAAGSNSGFRSDSAFKKLFPGLAIKSANSGNALAYFDLTNQTKTKLTVYYRYKKSDGTGDTTAAVSFVHSGFGQANPVNVQAGGSWASALSGSSDKVYIESSPSGAFASIAIPGLSSFPNAVIHRAEIIAEKVPSAGDNVFTPPTRLLLDRIRKNGDSSYLFEKDLLLGSDGSIGYDVFGGTLSNSLYRFNITRYVQGIVTRHERNDTLRLWAPLRAYEFATNQTATDNSTGTYIQIPVNNRIADGRIVLGGGAYAVPGSRLRLRIVYSKL
jgi:hypothetical protein